MPNVQQVGRLMTGVSVERAKAAGQHLPVLDGVRGLAIALVMVLHFTFVRGSGPLDDALAAVAGAGWVGVDLFFVLSGFLITGILLDAKGGPHYFRNFYIRRSLRIFPLYYGFLFVLFVVVPVVLPRLSPRLGEYVAREAPGLLGLQGWYWAYAVNVMLARANDFNLAPLGTVHFWSLAVEEQFYLVWPAVAFVCAPRTLLRVCVACIVGSALLRVGLFAATHSTVPGFVLMPTRLDGLAVGGALAIIARRPGGLAPLARHAAATMLATGLLLVGLFAARRTPSSFDPAVQLAGYTLLAFFFGALIARALTAPPGGWLPRLFAHPALRTLGKYSYGVYVFHLPLVGLLRRAVGDERLIPPVLGSRVPAQLAFYAAAGLLSLGIAVVSWQLFERHFLKLKDRFPYERLRAAAASRR